MAVVLDSWSVVARRSAVEATLPNGLASWFELAPNQLACADGELCAVAFMASQDAQTFIAKLDALGLRGAREGAYREVALVDEDGPWQHPCPWLRVGRHGGVNAAWLDGSDPDPIVVPLAWKPNQTFRLSAEEAAARLKFLRRDGDIEVYLDTETGEERFLGRTTPRDDLPPELQTQLQSVHAAIAPLLTFDGRPKRLGFFQRRRLAKGIRALEQLAAGGHWRVLWLLGMARRAAARPDAALEAFERAYAVNPTRDMVARELAGQYLALGLGAQAVAVCDRICGLDPQNAELRANLALACLVAGDLQRAQAEVARALAHDSKDRITQQLASMIDEVIAKRKPRPTKYP